MNNVHRSVAQHNVVGLVNKSDAVDGVATCEQHNKCGDTSVRLVGTTNPQQIEVTEFALIVANGDNSLATICCREQQFAIFDDYSHQCGHGFRRRRPFWIIVQFLSFDNGSCLVLPRASYAYVNDPTQVWRRPSKKRLWGFEYLQMIYIARIYSHWPIFLP